jgi:hypothetical protein
MTVTGGSVKISNSNGTKINQWCRTTEVAIPNMNIKPLSKKSPSNGTS